MQKTTIDPMHLLGMMNIDLESIVSILLDSRGITKSDQFKEPSEDEIEEMWECAEKS